METVDIVLGIVLIVASLFLIIAVLMQHGKAHNLSGTIAGGAETFFGKSKGKSIDKKLSTITTVIAIIFVLIVLAVYLMQDSADVSGKNPTGYNSDAAQTTVAADEESSEGTDTAEDTGSSAETSAPAETSASDAETSAPAETSEAAA